MTSGGVIMAAMIKIIRTTYFLYFINLVALTSLSWVNNMISMGSSNIKPEDNKRVDIKVK